MKIFSQIFSITTNCLISKQLSFQRNNLLRNNYYRFMHSKKKSASSSSSLTSSKRKHKSSSPVAVTKKTMLAQSDSKNIKSKCDYTYFTKRKWQSVGTYHQTDSTAIPFTLMSYNCLAQDLIDAHPYLYSDHNCEHLDWNNRFKLLINEIQYINPDILCLQEVQQSHLNAYIAQLKIMNLDQHIYKKRTSSDKTDGCAIFYNSNKFELLSHETLEYYQPKVKLLDRPNVAILAKFSSKENPLCKCVITTTHLLYNPKRQDIRLAQIQLLLAEIDRMSSNGRNINGKLEYIPSILTGDFNLEPHTAPYKLLTDGHIKYEHRLNHSLKSNVDSSQSVGKNFLPQELDITDDCQHLSANETKLYHSDKNNAVIPSAADVMEKGLNNRDKYPFSTGTLRHKLNLCSAYNTSRHIASTFQDEWILVDYIFYSQIYNSKYNIYEEGALKLLQIYELPTYEDCNKIRAIPNNNLGSDHLSLAAKFMLSSTSADAKVTNSKPFR